MGRRTGSRMDAPERKRIEYCPDTRDTGFHSPTGSDPGIGKGGRRRKLEFAGAVGRRFHPG